MPLVSSIGYLTIWLASEIDRPENRDLAGILVKFFSFLLGVEDAELLLSLQAKSKEDADAKKSSVRFNQAQVPVLDSFALLLREQEQKRSETASRMKSMRNQRMTGTFKTFVNGHDSNGTTVVMQKNLGNFAVPTLSVPSKFGRAKLPISDPSTRADVQGGGRSRISPAVTCLVECSESFMKSCFNSLLFAALYDIQQERENLSEGGVQWMASRGCILLQFLLTAFRLCYLLRAGTGWQWLQLCSSAAPPPPPPPQAPGPPPPGFLLHLDQEPQYPSILLLSTIQ